jgi:hypothetical protein
VARRYTSGHHGTFPTFDTAEEAALCVARTLEGQAAARRAAVGVSVCSLGRDPGPWRRGFCPARKPSTVWPLTCGSQRKEKYCHQPWARLPLSYNMCMHMWTFFYSEED